MTRTAEEILDKFNSIPNLDEVFDIMGDMSRLKEERGKLEEEVKLMEKELVKLREDYNGWDEMYVQTIANVGMMVKTLDDLGKVAGNFNGKTQAMNVVYMCCEALRAKHPNSMPEESLWDNKNVTGIKNLMLDSFKILKADERNS